MLASAFRVYIDQHFDILCLNMPGLPRRTIRIFRPSATPITRTLLSQTAPIARLHQQGPSRSAVVHEQALPQSQSQVESASFLSNSHSTSTKTTSSIQNDTTNLDAIISHIPLVQSLRTTPKAYKETRPHLAIPPGIRQHHLVGGSLTGPGKLSLAPYMWTSSQKNQTSSSSRNESNLRARSVISAFHIGRDLCGHPGFVHGGLLSVLFDEVFARCVSGALPSGLGMTANLNVDFRRPALPERVYILRAETVKVEGRKAWVEGRMTYLPLPLVAPFDVQSVLDDVELLREDGDGAVMVAEAKALFVEPKFADSMVSIYKN